MVPAAETLWKGKIMIEILEDTDILPIEDDQDVIDMILGGV